MSELPAGDAGARGAHGGASRAVAGGGVPPQAPSRAPGHADVPAESDPLAASGTLASVATVHRARYRRCDRRLSAARWKFLAIVAHGVRVALKDPRNVLLAFAGLGLVLVAAVIFYVLALFEDLIGTRDAQGLYHLVQMLLRVDLSDVARTGVSRLPLWESIFVLMIKVELISLLIVIGHFGAGLIANDLRTNALPIYFARPITPLTYLLGKWLTIAGFIAMAMLVPNLLALLAGILVAGAPGSWEQTLRLAGCLAASGAGVMLVGGLVILALSSLTADKRIVIVSWLALALLTTGFLGSLSLSGDVLILATWLFDLPHTWQATGLPPQAYAAALGPAVQPLYPALVLLGTTGLAAVICYRQVVRFSRAAAKV
jgi:ABC-type transport system involved in multi-copper enzyme maturation permease subunit